MNHFKEIFICAVLGLTACTQQKNSYDESFVRVSRENPSYFCLSNGDPFIPIGCNIPWSARNNMQEIENCFKALSENGANYTSLLLNMPTWEIYGTKWDSVTNNSEVLEEKFARIDQALDLAGKYGLKVKMRITGARYIRAAMEGQPPEWVMPSWHIDNGGPFANESDWMERREEGIEVYLKRVQLFKDRYGDDPRVFAWELWAEMNTLGLPRGRMLTDLPAWTGAALPRVHEIFPHNMVVQNLGSMPSGLGSLYPLIMNIPGQDYTQGHQYIDEREAPGRIPEIKGPVDVMASHAIGLLRSMGLNKPVLLAETGAVQPFHARRHRHLDIDHDGVFLHDGTFAPFFSGSAGTGQFWHHDTYINGRNIWYHYRRFANVVEGVNPVKERFEPVRADQPGFRVYILKGKKNSLVWIRDTENTWMAEFGVDPDDPTTPPKLCSGIALNFGDAFKDRKISKIEIYDPWEDRWTDASASIPVALPDFKRSIVVKIKH